MWVQLVILIVTAIIAYQMAPKAQDPPPAGIGDFDVPTAEEDRTIPVVFGRVWIKGPNVVWYGDLKTQKVKKKGGKK